MSVLLIGLDEERGPAVVRRLLEEGDIVGVIEEDASRGELWRDLGAHVAFGSALDPDLVERAAQHARSIVVFDTGAPGARVLEAVLEGARLAPGETARIVYVARAGAPGIRETLESSAFDYVLLRTGGRGGWFRRRNAPDADALAAAVSAADDLAGRSRTEVDLSDAEGWRALALDPR